jgi:hypothetical protein
MIKSKLVRAAAAFVVATALPGCPATTAVNRAFATTMPTLPTPPTSRGILTAWLRTEYAPEHEGTRRSPDVSIYSPSFTLGGGLGARLSRYMEVRILGDAEGGSIDAYGNNLYSPMGAGRVGPGIVIGWSSDATPWSLQATFDTPVSILEWRGLDQCADCMTPTFFPRGDTRVAIEPRLTLVGGLWLTSWLRIFGQIGWVTRSRGTLADTFVLDSIIATQVGAEVHLDSSSLVVEVQNIAFDPILAWGPVFSASLRTSWGDGPGSRPRVRTWRDAIEE